VRSKPKTRLASTETFIDQKTSDAACDLRKITEGILGLTEEY
jgi:hypothetical protein